MGAAAAAMLIAERRIVEAFETAGATAPELARRPEELNVEFEGRGWRRLHSRAVVREVADGSGRYYLDLEVWQALRRTRRRLLLVVFLMVGIAAAALMLSQAPRP